MRFGIVALLAVQVCLAAGVSLVSPAVIPIGAAGSGTGVLRFKNDGDKQDLPLLIGVLKAGVVATFPDEKGSDKSRTAVSVPPHDFVDVKLAITGATDSGDVSVDIYSKTDKLGTVVAHTEPFPFNVHLAGATAAAANIFLKRGTESGFTLKNDDAFAYPVQWQLRVGRHVLVGKEAVILGPNGTAAVSFTPPGDWFDGWFRGLFEVNSTKDAELTLTFIRSKALPVTANLAYYSGNVRQVGSIFQIGAVLLLLILGGMTSLFVSYALPNLLASLSMRARLKALGDRIDGVSSRVDSRLRVLINIERARLLDLLGSTVPVSSGFGDVLGQCSEGAALLDTRTGLASQLDTAREEFQILGPRLLAPTFIRSVDAKLQEAADQLRKLAPAQADFDAARAAIAAASDEVRKTPTDPAFAATLAKRVASLMGRVALHVPPPAQATGATAVQPALAPSLFFKISGAVPAPFAVLKDDLKIAANIQPADYGNLDMQLSKLEILVGYVELRAGATDAVYLQRLDAHETELVNLLQRQSWETYSEAVSLYQFMREDIYPEDLAKELATNTEADALRPMLINMEPPSSGLHAPIEFSCRFRKPLYDAASAKGQITYRWQINQNDTEKGWSVWCYFPQKRKEQALKVTLAFDLGTAPVKDAQGKRVEITRSVETPALSDRINADRRHADYLQMGVALSVAVFGLLAGAKDKLAALDWISASAAIFALGFGADQVKKLVTQTGTAATKK